MGLEKKQLSGWSCLGGTAIFTIAAAVLVLSTLVAGVETRLGAHGSGWLRIGLALCCLGMAKVYYQMGMEVLKGRRPDDARWSEPALAWMYLGSGGVSFFICLIILMTGWYAPFAIPVLAALGAPVLLVGHALVPVTSTKLVRVDMRPRARPSMPPEPVPLRTEPADEAVLVLARPTGEIDRALVERLASATNMTVYDLRRGLLPEGPVRPLALLSDRIVANELISSLQNEGIVADTFSRDQIATHCDSAVKVARLGLQGDEIRAVSSTGDVHVIHRRRLQMIWLGQREGGRDPFLVFQGGDENATFVIDSRTFDFGTVPLPQQSVGEKLVALAELLARAGEIDLDRFFFERQVQLSTWSLLDGVGPVDTTVLQTLVRPS